MGSASALPCLLLCTLYLTAGASAKPHYLVLFPYTLYYPHPGKVHIHLLDLDAPVRVTLHMASHHGVPNVTLEEQGNEILQLNWPHFPNISTPSASMYEVAHLHISIQGGSLQVSEQREVLVKALEPRVLVQTDKDVYEPGQTVKILIVHLDQNFIASNREIPLVVVQDPNENLVAVWWEVSPQQGIVDLSFSLAAEPALGTYTITVEGSSHQFSVKDSGLPNFEVLIRLPRFVTDKDKKIPMDVCGQYPSGKTFRGRAEARLCQFHSFVVFLNGSKMTCAEFRGQTGRNGCFSAEVPATFFNLTSLDYEDQLHAFVSLLEEGTGRQREANKSCMIVYEEAMITFESSDKFYKPGVPYTGTMLLKGINGSALAEEEFLLVVNTIGEIQRKTLLTDGSGRASFKLDTSGWKDKVLLHGELKQDPPASEDENQEYLNYKSASRSVYPFSVDSRSYLKIHRVIKKLPCRQPQQLSMDYLFDEKAMESKQQSLDVVLLVLAKGTIATVLRKELPAEAGLSGSFSLELPIGPELAPVATVLGYVVLPDGEIVADSTELKVAKCFPSKVNLSFSEQRALVGSQLRMKVQAAPGSLCAIYAVDQRAQSSSRKGKGKLNPDMVYNLLPAFSGYIYPFKPDEAISSHCSMDEFGGMSLAIPAINCFDVPARKRMCRRRPRRWQVPRPDAQPGSYSLFKDAGLKTVTNAELGCPSSTHLYPQVPQLEDDPLAGVMEDPGMQTGFLETWLWELVPVGDRGSAEVAVTVPDVITEWEVGMFCTSPLGLGLAPATTLTAFKPFFVELALPYAVVQHEAFTLVATVFNYLQQCLRVRVTLVESVELEVSAGSDEVNSGCVCADETRTFQWDVRATRLGEVNVTIITRALHSEELCGTEVPVVPAHGHVDTETKLLMVQVSTLRSYVVVSPAVIYHPYTAMLWVHISGLHEPVQVSIQLQRADRTHNITLFERKVQDPHLYLNITFPAPAPTKGKEEIVDLLISIQGDSLHVSMKKVMLRALEPGIFIQTDKAVYKPGQQVKFRIVSLDKDFAPSNKKRARLQRLAQHSISAEGQLFWRRKGKALSPSQPSWAAAAPAEVEMAAYVLLAYLSQPQVSSADLGTASQIVCWLSKQHAGTSTRDTVVALQALAKYAALTYSSNGDLMVTVTSPLGNVQDVLVRSSRRLVLLQAALELPGPYVVQARGQGCALVQVTLRYNVPPPPSTGMFDLHVGTEPKECTGDASARFHLILRARYTGDRRATNMVVIEAKLPSGYSPKSSVVELKRQKVVKVEVKPDQVTIYLDPLTKEEETFTFTTRQDFPVRNPQAATVMLHDYYETGDDRRDAAHSTPCSSGGG
ncbi:alpha-2-macroglobulin-like protein 1 [Strigops habroptila]|uniref:alpha-2-macroglobulin-like protein 1 n=1 Tax=Strigops habroptila TaxID=2489341 RepID=UPI0011CFD5B3|nr:alpha-2-macroglobulin-like protein 1 [Strigops habroptila]